MFSIDDIKDEEEIRTLSARQLKLLLARSFVDFKGCVEREELVKKAVLLYNDKKANQLKGYFFFLFENLCLNFVPLQRMILMSILWTRIHAKFAWNESLTAFSLSVVTC